MHEYSYEKKRRGQNTKRKRTQNTTGCSRVLKATLNVHIVLVSTSNGSAFSEEKIACPK